MSSCENTEFKTEWSQEEHVNNRIEKEAQQTHLSGELIFEEDQSLPGMFLHSEN